jgi:hypothetical protein
MTKDDLPVVEIRVRTDSIDRYTAIFQTGVTLVTPGTVSIGVFLDKLPGFTMDYINNRVQTIFLNGSAMDDLETPLIGTHPVLALSAAMPGLAGAIFRRNSMHAALRSANVQHPMPSGQPKTIAVTLKLFNMIAAEKGADILAQGVGFTGAQLTDFFADHPTLVTSITHAFLTGQALDRDELMQQLDRLGDIRLIIRKSVHSGNTTSGIATRSCRDNTQHSTGKLNKIVTNH